MPLHHPHDRPRRSSARRSRPGLLVATGTAAALLLSACGSDSGAPLSSSAGSSSSAAAATAGGGASGGGTTAGSAPAGSTGSTAAPAGPTDPRANTLIIAENEIPATFDPVQADNSTVDEVVIPAYDTLLSYDSSGKLAGILASGWKVDSKGTTVTVDLKPGVKFHDGTALTAKDVVFTLDRIKKLGIGVASFTTAYASSKAVADDQVAITLKAPYAPFLSALTRVYIVNSALVTKNAGSDDGQKWLATNDAGSGPYSLVKYTNGQQAEFTRFDGYFRGFTGQAKDVVFRYISEASTQKSSLRNGDVDVAMDIAPNDWASFAADSQFKVDQAPTNVVLSVFFNMYPGSKLQNKALRQAIEYSYNYQQHIDKILKGAGQRVVGPMASGMSCADKDLDQPTYDPAKAKKLLADAGLSGVHLTMTYLKATAEMEQAAALLHSNLADIGVTLDLQAITYPQYAELVAKPETTPDLGMIYAFPAYPDADAVMYVNYDSKFIGGGQNWGGFSDKNYDALVEKAQQLTDESQRCQLYTQAQQQVMDDALAVNMSNPKAVAVYNARLSGFTYRASHHQTVDVYAISVS
ncbi:ABC transporter substrate-binding protein [Nakamurella endophytica]|uniref:ABC transporter substrate-binding protein n=1 Tax=Nakamurella endophytica TaxID=1748367 RepID=A0A917T9L6_9ACTN|nr:ABC transporter substrate-binding protein [Nakamurella endophytica]GGM15512.1 ABC transporter substrate-binding protein [Nakamurella endophytica]